MKILLIQPSDFHVDGNLKGGVWHAPPLGLASLASFLRVNNHIPQILDLAVDEREPNKLCQEFNPDYVGFSVTSSLFFEAGLLAKKIKSQFPEIKIIFGGSHPSTEIKGVLEEDYVDFVVFGEGELTLSELLDSKSFDKIDGLAYKEGKEIKINSPRVLIKDLDTLPIPAYDLLKVYKYPSHPLSKRSPNISIITSRGCPFGCTYCSKAVFGRTFRKMSYNKVVDMMEYLINKYGMKEFQIIDDTFTLDKERVKDICLEIIRRKLKIKWMTPNGIRAGSVDLETLGLMKKAGCHYLYLGIESGSPKILKRINKGMSIEEARNTVDMINKVGIRVGAFFMLGLPDETEKEIKETISFAKSLNLDSVKFGILVPLPGTEIFEEFKKNGFIQNYDYSTYFWHKEPVFETNLISKDKLFKYYKQAYREFYLRPKYIFNKMISLNSLSDIKNIFNGLRIVINNQLSKKQTKS